MTTYREIYATIYSTPREAVSIHTHVLENKGTTVMLSTVWTAFTEHRGLNRVTNVVYRDLQEEILIK